MRSFLFFLAILVTSFCFAQKGDELLVYSLKGNVSVVENNAESKLKIGKVLKSGAYIKTQKLAQLTMVCKQGKPISVTHAGTFPVDKWKDSCTTSGSSITTRYFQFIWDQLYVRSDDYKKDHPGTDGNLTDAPVRGNEELELVLNPLLDTLFYAGEQFRLPWTVSKPYDGKYYFTLTNGKSKKVVFRDSITQTYIAVDALKKWMRPGSTYLWTVSLNNSSKGEGGVIRYITATQLYRQIEKFRKMVTVPEDLAAQNFRIGYILKQNWYASNAYQYFYKAANALPGTEFYKEKLEEFRKEFDLK